MDTYDFQEATADRIADIFRRATINSEGNEIKTGGRRRVLLADEVGLGKTHVAKAVIDRVREMRREVDDKMFRVVYVCSNMSIANQNIEKLDMRHKADVSESRLSMQHLTIREREEKIHRRERGEMGEIIIPLTPSTSFSLRGGSRGNVNERALIVDILRRLDSLARYGEELSRLFQCNVNDQNWDYCLGRYSKRVDDLKEEYIETIRGYLDKDETFRAIEAELIEAFRSGGVERLDKTRVINSLRRVFANLSLGMLEPDLIIMDEFQRFSSLLDYTDESEQSIIVKKFFEQQGGQEPLILLLSATPYKPFSTLEELSELNADEHYEDFNRLMDFLFAGERQFKEVWADYSHKLSHLSSEDFEVVLVSKNVAEDTMYEAMCRTERLNEGLISTRGVDEIAIDADDILSYVEMQKILTSCSEAAPTPKASRLVMMPTEYVKSSPYLLSFMESYELKRIIETVYKEKGAELPKPSGRVLLSAEQLNNFHRLPLRNARLRALRDRMLPRGKGAELLLWVPATRPYYTTNVENPFVRNKDFSKMLVFSAWEMVPRMIATLMTYEAEREVIFAQYKKAGYSKKTGEGRLKEDAKNILKFPSVYLASLYDPSLHYGEKIQAIKVSIRRVIKERLDGIDTTKRRSYGKILEVIRWLDSPDSERPAEMPGMTVDLLTDMAIASPGVCLLRIMRREMAEEDAKRAAEKAAAGFAKVFNRRIAGYIVDRLQNKYHDDELYLEGVMDYCVMGSLQAVLDEYRHLCSSAVDFVEKMNDAFIEGSNLQVDTDKSFGAAEGGKFPMRVSYAVPLFKTKNSTGDTAQERTDNVRAAFQSPFYPFVLATTSVGQEGLDFHWYCRKIMHWNLPSNPQDLEQREGRINRYKCLAIRRNLARLYPEQYDWEQLFEKARADVRRLNGSRYSEMVPCWCLPREWIQASGESLEMIERIVPLYPMSSDVTRYRRLIDVLSLYRLTLGQPRQEELVEMLASRQLTPEQISSLLFNLSPISRRGEEA